MPSRPNPPVVSGWSSAMTALPSSDLTTGSGQNLGDGDHLCAGAQRPLSHQHHDTFTLVEQIGGALYVGSRRDDARNEAHRCCDRCAASAETTLIRLEIGIGLLKIDRDRQMADRAPTQCRAHGVVDEAGDRHRHVNHRVVGSDVLEDTVEMNLLLKVRAEQRRTLHAGDRQNRGVVELRRHTAR